MDFFFFAWEKLACGHVASTVCSSYTVMALIQRRIADSLPRRHNDNELDFVDGNSHLKF